MYEPSYAERRERFLAYFCYLEGRCTVAAEKKLLSARVQ